MLLDLSRYRQPLDHFARTFEPAEVGDEGDTYRVVAPVRLEFDVHKDKAAFRLAGTVETVLELACGRCLDPYTLPVSAAFDLRYLPATSASEAPDHEVQDDDLEVSYYEEDRVDLNELLREQFYLVLPMKPLCGEQCRGLCAQCGTNLNTSTCDCAPVWEDPRLAALKGLGKSN